MSKKFVPEIGDPQTVTRTVVETRPAFTNRPPAGTRMRARLGKTVIVGTFDAQNHYDKRGDMLSIRPEGTRYVSALSCWFEDGWTFQILDDEVPA